MSASSTPLMNASSRPRAARAWAGVIGLVRFARSSPVSRRFFGSGEGSMQEQMAWKQYADPRVGGQEPRRPAAVPVMPSSAREASLAWRNSRWVAWVRNSGQHPAPGTAAR